MSAAVVTRPWFTKNFAGGALDNHGLLRACGSDDDDAGAISTAVHRNQWRHPQKGRLRDDGARRGPARDGPGSGSYDRRVLLAVDIGNSNVTLGLFRAGEVVATRRATTHPRQTADELEHTLTALLALDGVALADLTAIVVASVVPALSATLEAVALRRDRHLLAASAGTVPIAVRVDRPGDVGADRLVNALAAGRLHGTPAVVVDLGTATTFDCVGVDGAYVGGAIAPGLELGLDALAARTAKLPRVELRSPDRAIGRDTVSAIQSGAVLGYQALVGGLLARIRDELAETTGVAPARVHTVLTGGLSAAPWARAVTGVDAIEPDLTLRGLAILHAEVTAGRQVELELR